MPKGKIELIVSDSDPNCEEGDDNIVAYLTLPSHPANDVVGWVARTVRLWDLLPDYKGVDLYFDFDKDNCLIGVEILE